MWEAARWRPWSPLPADPIAKWSEDEAAEWAHEEGSRENRERVEQCRGLVSGREEVRRDERGQKAVDGEVELPIDAPTITLRMVAVRSSDATETA